MAGLAPLDPPLATTDVVVVEEIIGYAHWPQLGTQFIALLGTKFGAH